MYALAERKLYFSTDRSPGFGGYDLVRVPYLGGQGWGSIENLGPNFNSSYDDTYPFVWSADRLYFSSNRPGGRYLDPDAKNCCPDIFRADQVPPPPPVVDTTAIVGIAPPDTSGVRIPLPPLKTP